MDASNGIDKKEAVVLATDYIRKNQLSDKVSLSRARVKDSWQDARNWAVTFPPSFKTMFSLPFKFEVVVSKKDGSIQDAHWNK